MDATGSIARGLAEPLLVERGAGVVLGQHVLERGVVPLDPDHRGRRRVGR